MFEFLRWKTAVPVGLFCLLVLGCTDNSASSSQPTDEPGKLNVVCTTNVVKDLVRQVGGERINVTAIMDGPGIDPHTYTPSPGDTNLLTGADVVVYSGLHLEGQLDTALESLHQRDIPVICLTETLENDFADRLLSGDSNNHDPHVWFDPELWAICAEHCATELTNLDPEGADEYSSAAEQFTKQMQDTLNTGRELVASIPAERRVLVTAHDAFAYFARAFEFKVEAVQGISTESEPGLKRINDLITLLTENGINAVFTEQSVSDKNIAALIDGCGRGGHTVTIGGRLYSDTVGVDGTPEGTLSGALLHNIRQMAKSLGTEVSDAPSEAGK